ncbi:MAG: DUF1538 domain-containing protein [Magnetococcales bacterium]|nr:DUF1538 domain-containing protein [Magnetococcales bacterium]
METLGQLWNTMLETGSDLVPIIALLLFFQMAVLRRPIPRWREMAVGMLFVYLGLGIFLYGLETALFPLGKTMALQLTHPQFVFGAAETPAGARPLDYIWVYIFGALIGFATTVAEPALMAVALKAHEVSRGAIHPFSLRISVAVGVAIGIGLGTFRIVTGDHLAYYIVVGYIFVILQTAKAPRFIIPLAYDSGGVTTSTVTVPLVAALGLGLSSTIPGRNPAVDGFGLIAFASLFPMMTVMGYAQYVEWSLKRRKMGDIGADLSADPSADPSADSLEEN